MGNLSGLKYKMESIALDNPLYHSDNHVFYPPRPATSPMLLFLKEVTVELWRQQVKKL
jgi:hypothetical protein